MKRIAGVALKVAISGGLIALFFRQVEWSEIEAAALSADPVLLALSALLFATSNVLGAVQWRVLLLQQEIALPFRQVIMLYLVGVFFNNFMVGNIGGDAVRVYDLQRLTGRGAPGFAATFLDRFIGLFVLICFSVGAFAFLPDLWQWDLGAPIAALGLSLLGVLCFGFSRRLSGAMLRAGQRILPARVGVLIEGVRTGFMHYRRAYRMLGGVALIACAVQVCRVGVYYLVGLSMGLTVGYAHYVVFIPMIAIVAAVPISFGGIGVRENMGALLFGRVGVEPAAGLTLMFLGYLAGIVASLVGGIAFVLRRTMNRERPE